MDDLISRQAAIDALNALDDGYLYTHADYVDAVRNVPSVEPLTDKEQRIFLAAMGREEEVCKGVDDEYCREPYEDTLVRTCHKITRKVKGVLWT